ncbi:hypothetical protein [Streptosporangium sp. NPDC002524]|uniref:hypothetical protein n=1 Tax=Streptosporangium sp. NPDC002524 TaxID=3154537 RepID=UPI00332AE32A
MDTTADRTAAAYFGAVEFLREVTPMGRHAGRGTARAAVTGAGSATPNAVYDTAPKPDRMTPGVGTRLHA